MNGRYTRGWIYFAVAVLTPMADRCAVWAEQGKAPVDIPAFELAAVGLGAFVAGLIAMRAYIDQHLSRNA